MRERRTNLLKRAEFERLRLRLRDRLSAVCAQMAATELDLLTARMTRLEQKYKTSTSMPEI